jgi:hypothetical protein
MNPYGYLVAAILFLCAIGGAYVKGRTDGDKITRAEYVARDLQASEEARIAEKGLSARYRAQEQQWQGAFQVAGKQYERKLDAQATAARVAESVRLHDPYATVQACSGGPSQASANTNAANAGGADLSPKFASFLRSEASRADAVVAKLNFCIDTLESERR